MAKCKHCKEQETHNLRECPACQPTSDTRAALLRTRAALRALLDETSIFIPEAEEAEKALQWPKRP